MDGSQQEIERSEANAVVAYRNVFQSPCLQAPVEGVVCHRGKLVPVFGPMPRESHMANPAETRPWLLLMKDHAQVIQGFPRFPEDAIAEDSPPQLMPLTETKTDHEEMQEEDALLAEIEELLKSA